MDTAPGTRHVFPLASDDTLSTAARERRFAALVADYSPKTKRQHIVEADYLDALNKHLRIIAKIRIRKVQDWVKANIARFPSDQSDVGKLITQFEKLKKELMHSIDVCGSRCEHCRLLCLRPKHHDGEHNCTTDHRCVHSCALDRERPCGFPYVKLASLTRHYLNIHYSQGWPRRKAHVSILLWILLLDTGSLFTGRCDVKLHLCGEICSLRAKKGCLKECSKVGSLALCCSAVELRGWLQNVGHDGEHICEASSHACGQPCRLGKVGLCNSSCAVD
jgi:hypothetical protein